MKKSSKRIFVFIFLTFLIIAGIIIRTPDTKMPVDTIMPLDTGTSVQELRAGGLFIEFENGTTETEVKTILENRNKTRNYIIKYNVDYMGNRYYVKVDEDKRKELRKEKNWNDPVIPEIPEPRFPEIEKGNYSYIIVSEEDLEDESFLMVMEKHNLQVKKSIVCYLLFGDGSQNWNEPKNWILGREAIIIKNELEMDEKVLTVNPDYIEG